MSEEKKETVKCMYCLKEIEGKPFFSKVISRNWKPSYISPERTYCNQTCASHDQMAHEG
jgi:hypothetical protein